MRSGARQLTQKEANALGGTLYRNFAETLEDNPGAAEMWRGALEANALAEAGRYGSAPLIIGFPAQARRRSLEERFGAFADMILKREGLVIDAPSRALLIAAISKAMTDATLSERARQRGARERRLVDSTWGAPAEADAPAATRGRERSEAG